MTTALRYRLFGMGKMPSALKDASTLSPVLLASEGVSVKQSVQSLKLSRASVSRGTKLLIGSVVLLPSRVLLSVGSHTIVDCGIDADTGPATLSLASDGLRLVFDVHAATRQGSGTVALHYRVSVPAAVLDACPKSVAVAVREVRPALLSGWQGQHG